MPVFRFMNPSNGVITEQYRGSVMDLSSFFIDEIEYELYDIIPDYEDRVSDNFTSPKGKAALYSPLMFKALKTIISNSEDSSIDFLKCLYSHLSEKDKVAFLLNLDVSCFQSFDDESYEGEDGNRREFIEEFTNPDRNLELRRNSFGADKVDVEKSEIADHDKTVKFKVPKRIPKSGISSEEISALVSRHKDS